MSLISKNDLYTCLDAAKVAAREAGVLIMNYFGQQLDVLSKGFSDDLLMNDVVTRVDSEAQQIILNRLTEIFPGRFAINAEEDGYSINEERFNKEAFWCIDPLDGTLFFLRQHNGFCVNIGLVGNDGEPLLGVVYSPALDVMVSAIVGEGTWIGDQKVDVNKPGEKLHFIFNSYDILNESKSRMLRVFRDVLKTVDGVKSVIPVPFDSAPVHIRFLEQWTPWCVLTLPLSKGGASIWDIAAHAAVVRGAGGNYSDLWGNRINLNPAGSTFIQENGLLFTSNPIISEKIISAFKNQDSQ